MQKWAKSDRKFTKTAQKSLRFEQKLTRNDTVLTEKFYRRGHPAPNYGGCLFGTGHAEDTENSIIIRHR